MKSRKNVYANLLHRRNVLYSLFTRKLVMQRKQSKTH